MTYQEDEKEGNGWIGHIGSGANAGTMDIMLYDNGRVHLETKNDCGDFTNLSIQIYSLSPNS